MLLPFTQLICRVIIFSTLLSMYTAAINPPGRFILEKHPSGLTCTLYIKQYDSADTSILNQIIHDNKQNFLISLASDGNHTLPDPTITFLEQCSLNIIIAEKEYPAGHIYPDYPKPKDVHLYENIHRVRSRIHSAFLFIINDCLILSGTSCSGLFSYKSTIFVTPIFVHFISCGNTDPSLFPNSFIDYKDTSNCRLKLLYKKIPYSIYASSPPIEYIPRRNPNVYVAMIDILSQKLDYYNTLRWNHQTSMYRRSNEFIGLFLQSFQKHFNLTLWWNTFGLTASGSLTVNQYVNGLSKFTEFLMSSRISNVDESYVRFIYCLDNPPTTLLTLEALVSPFELLTWMCILAVISLVSCVQLKSRNGTYTYGNLSFIFRIIFEQNVNLKDISGFLICISILVITSLYRTFLTSNLLAPAKISPVPSIQVLIDRGYSFKYDSGLHPAIFQMINSSKLNFKNVSIEYSKVGVKEFDFSIAALYKDSFTATLLRIPETTWMISSMRKLQANMTCFTSQKNLETVFYNYLYIHPNYEKMKLFTDILNTNGILNLFSRIELNTKHTVFQATSRKRAEDLANEASEKIYITLTESWPVFLLLLVCLAFALGTFIASKMLESKNIVKTIHILPSLPFQRQRMM